MNLCEAACAAVIVKCYSHSGQLVSLWLSNQASGCFALLPKLAGNFCCLSWSLACAACSSCLVNVTQTKIKNCGLRPEMLSRLLRQSSHYCPHQSYDMCTNSFLLQTFC